MKRTESPEYPDRNSERRSILTGVWLLIVFVSVITLILLYNSYNQTRKITMEVITESASQSSAKLREAVHSAANRLEGLASILAEEPEIDEKKAIAVTTSLRHDSLFSDLAIRLADGTVIKGQGQTQSDIQWNKEVALSPDRSNITISKKTTSQITSKEIIRMFTPIGDTQNYLYGIIETDRLSEEYTSSGFSGNSALIAFEADSLGIFMDTGSGFEIQSNAIGTLNALVFANGHSKNEFHADINKNMSGNTVIDTPDGKMVCAYLPVGISNWYIMQVVPESILFSQLHRNSTSLVFVLLATAAGLLIFALWINSRTAKSSMSVKNARFQVNVRDSILANALSDSSIRVFLYYRNTDTVVILKSGETPGTAEQSSEIKNGLDYIIKSEMLSSDDARKLRNAFSLSGSGKVKKLTVCSHKAGEETFLRYTLTRSKDEFGKENIIIGTARDITEFERTKQKQLDLESFRSTVVDYNTTGLEIFLESGRWKIVWNNEPLFSALATTGAFRPQYDSDLEKIILPSIHPSDRTAFSGIMNRLNLLSDFRKGTSEKTLQYRIKTSTNDEEYEYRVLEIHTLRDKSTDEAKADIYIRNVEKNDLEKYSGSAQKDKVMRMADGVFAALSGTCTHASFADLDKNTIYIISYDGKTLCRKPSAVDFKKRMYEYADENLHPEDRCLFISNNSREYLEKHLTESTPVVTHYRVKRGSTDEYMPAFSVARLVSKTEGRFEVTFVEQTGAC